MLSKEDNELYKAKYMQVPVTTLTEKNLSRLEEHCKKAIHFERIKEEHEVTLTLVYEYKKLESEKRNTINKIQETIEMLEDTLDLCKTDGNVARYRMNDIEEEISDLKEILEIVKGEANE